MANDSKKLRTGLYSLCFYHSVIFRAPRNTRPGSGGDSSTACHSARRTREGPKAWQKWKIRSNSQTAGIEPTTLSGLYSRLHTQEDTVVSTGTQKQYPSLITLGSNFEMRR
jgi:hypothetical protein